MATPSSGDDDHVDLESGGVHDHRYTAAPNSESDDDVVPTNLRKSGHGRSSSVPGRTPGGATANVNKTKKSSEAKTKRKKSGSREDSADSYPPGFAVSMMLVLCYILFVSYMICNTETWRRAAVGIVVATALLLVSLCMVACNGQSATRRESNTVKPPVDSDDDLGRRLLESDNRLENGASSSSRLEYGASSLRNGAVSVVVAVAVDDQRGAYEARNL